MTDEQLQSQINVEVSTQVNILNIAIIVLSSIGIMLKSIPYFVLYWMAILFATASFIRGCRTVISVAKRGQIKGKWDISQQLQNGFNNQCLMTFIAVFMLVISFLVLSLGE